MFTFLYKPLEQFEVNVYYPMIFCLNDYLIDISLTNLMCSFFFLILIFIYIYFITKGPFLGSSFYYIIELIFIFILENVSNQLGKKGQVYFPFIWVIFLFILFSNLIGLTPFAFAITSQMVINFTLSFALLIGITLLGIVNLKKSFFLLFYPSGIQKALLPLLICIEIISYVTRGFSLAIRLFANIMAGHTLLAILAMFAIKLGKFDIFAGGLVLFIITVVLILELVIAFLQAYVFLILTLIYFYDGLYSSDH